MCYKILHNVQRAKYIEIEHQLMRSFCISTKEIFILGHIHLSLNIIKAVGITGCNRNQMLYIYLMHS